jgi:hypothetical protein
MTDNDTNAKKIHFLLCNGKTPADVLFYAMTPEPNGLGLDSRVAKRMISAARRALRKLGEYDRDEQRGLSVARLSTLFAQAVADKDRSTAFSIQKEMNAMMGLRGGDDIAEPVAVPNVAAEAELAAVRAHLVGLNLAAPETSVVELVRLAVQRIVELTSGQKPL